MPKFREVRCEVCGEPVNPLHDYQDLLTDKTYSPREYVEHQLHMTDEEKEARERFFEELFEQHDNLKAEGELSEST